MVKGFLVMVLLYVPKETSRKCLNDHPAHGAALDNDSQEIFMKTHF